jgi:ribosome-binding factor A
MTEEFRAGQHRHARLERLLLEELSTLLHDEASDPAQEGVAVTAVTLSVDYRNARVHFTLGDVTERRRAERALERATPFFRARLADAIDLKRVPDLRFVFDGEAAEV